MQSSEFTRFSLNRSHTRRVPNFGEMGDGNRQRLISAAERLKDWTLSRLLTL